MTNTVTTTRTFEYDDKGRILRETVVVHDESYDRVCRMCRGCRADAIAVTEEESA